MNPEVGIVLTTGNQLEQLADDITVTAPNMEIPIWYIGDAKDLPKGVRSFHDAASFCQYLKDNPDIPIPDVAEAEWAKSLTDELNEIEAERKEQQKEIVGFWKQYQESWKWPKDSMPKVFCYCTYFSSVMQHSARGLLGGFKKNGCETMFFQEQSPISRVRYGTQEGDVFLPLAKAVNQFRPDLVLNMNWYRDPQLMGEKVPVLTWVQDRLSNLSAERAKNIKDNDFIAIHCRGFIDKWLAEGYPESQISFLPWGYDKDLFYPPEPGSKREGIVYLEQNAALSPQQAYAKFRAEVACGDPNIGKLLDAFYDRVSRMLTVGLDCYEYEYEAIWADVCGNAGASFPPSLRRNLLWKFSHDVGNRWFRQRPLVALKLAGLPLKIYGKGWKQHPELGQCAVGEIKKFEDIRKIYQEAQVVLSCQHETSYVHRPVEGLACGAHVAYNKLRVDNEAVNQHMMAHEFARARDVVPLCRGEGDWPGLLNIEPPPIEQTGVEKFEYKNLAKTMLDWLNEKLAV